MSRKKGKTAVFLELFFIFGNLEGDKVAKVPQMTDSLNFAAFCNLDSCGENYRIEKTGGIRLPPVFIIIYAFFF